MAPRQSAIWTPSGPIFVTETVVRQSNLGGVNIHATEPPEPPAIANVTGAQTTNATTQAGTVGLDPIWTFVAVSSPVTVTAAALTLAEPAGVQPGDLLVACIASRTTATTSVTLPANWIRVGEQNNNNALTNSTSAIASGTMAYIKRGASAPSFAFTLPAGISVAIGQVVAYRGSVAAAAMLDVATAVTTAINTTPVSVTGLTSTLAGDLVVAMAAGGQEAAWSAFNATTPAGASGATSTAAPGTAWLERADTPTTSGNDTSLAIFDAVKTTAGATGNLTVTASLGAGQVVIAGAFRIRDAAPAGISVTTGAQTTLATTQSATADVDLQVSAAQTTLATTQSGTIQAQEARAVTGAQTISETTQSATAGVRLTVTTGTQTTSAVTQAAAADVDAKLTGAQNALAATQSATADVDLAVTGAQTTLATTQSATASAAVRNVTAAQATLASSQSATAGVRLTVTGAHATLATTQAGTVGLRVGVTGAQTLSAATQSAIADVDLKVTGAQTLSAATQVGSIGAVATRFVTGAQLLLAPTQTGTISLGAAPVLSKTLVKHAGVWKQATVSVKHAGVWKAATPYVKQGGAWKQA